VLHRLRGAGASVVLDDFGTGCSSLTHLHALPIDGFKIDRSFISAATDPRSRALAEGLIALGTGLGLTVTAEGIETAEQAQWLADRGCALGQGYRFGRPAAAGVRRRAEGERANDDAARGAAGADADAAPTAAA
jgi:EAL domain-containing protein (putative c-di-GMP-specific phosphodiesterase class I)